MTTTIPTRTVRDQHAAAKAGVDIITSAIAKMRDAQGVFSKHPALSQGLTLLVNLAVAEVESPARAELARLTQLLTAPPVEPKAEPAPSANKVAVPQTATPSVEPIPSDSVLKGLNATGLKDLCEKHGVAVRMGVGASGLRADLVKARDNVVTKPAQKPAKAPKAPKASQKPAAPQQLVATPPTATPAKVVVDTKTTLDTMDRHTMLGLMAQLSDEQLRLFLGCLNAGEFTVALKGYAKTVR